MLDRGSWGHRKRCAKMQYKLVCLVFEISLGAFVVYMHPIPTHKVDLLREVPWEGRS